MKIYEIDQAIEDLIAESIDEETGELLIDEEKLNALQMEKDKKIENLALFIKNASAESAAIKNEEAALASRRKALDNSIDRAKQYLEFVLKGDKFKTARVVVSYRNSTSVTLDDRFLEWAQQTGNAFLRIKPPEPDKKLIGDALKRGELVPHASLTTNTTMTIK